MSAPPFVTRRARTPEQAARLQRKLERQMTGKQPRRRRPLKYVAGAVLSLDQLIAEVMQGRYVMWHGKPMHPGWMRSQQLGTLLGGVWGNAFCKAEVNPDWKEPAREC